MIDQFKFIYYYYYEFYYYCKCARGFARVCRCALVCVPMRRYARVCAGVSGCEQVYAGVRGYVRVCMSVGGCAWVWDEFSEFLLENRVPTSVDFNTYPIRIFMKIVHFAPFFIDSRALYTVRGFCWMETIKEAVEEQNFFPLSSSF